MSVKGSALNGLLYCVLVGLLLYYAHNEVKQTLQTDIYGRLCSRTIKSLVEDENKAIMGSGVTLNSGELTGKPLEYVSAAHQHLCDDYELLTDILVMVLFWLIIVKIHRPPSSLLPWPTRLLCGC